MLRLIFRLFRFALVAALGAAVAAKLLLESHADPDTEEVDLVSIFGGEHLASAANPFYGGRVLVMFGGAVLDLRKATPAPTGIQLKANVVAGGLSLVVPQGWRVEFNGDLYGGGFSDQTQTTADPDAPVVRIAGKVIAGGIQATTKSPLEAVA